MPIANLTDARIRGLKHADGEVIDQRTGLIARADRAGVVSFSFRYRNGTARRRMPLGRYPTITLADARAEVGRIRERVRGGADPQAERQARREVSETLTFDELADTYIERYAKRQKASWRQDQYFLQAHARPVWGARDAASITRQEIAKRLFEVADKTPVAANRLRSVLLKMFGWAADNMLIADNPGLGVKKPQKEKPGKTRVLNDAELRVLWRAFDRTGTSPGVVAALRTLLLLGQRPGEVAGMAVSELHRLGSPDARWEIPAEKMKGRKPHTVPLPPLACEVIQAACVRGQEFAFRSRFTEKARVSRGSLSGALLNLIDDLDGDGEDADAVASLKAHRPVPHDFRRTVATNLAKLGVPREDRLAVLAHAHSDVHSRHYDHHDRLLEKRGALTIWERHVRRAIAGKTTEDGADIIPLRSAVP